MEYLPKEVVAHVLFNYLDIDSIDNCYMASTIFHCLNDKQIIVVKNIHELNKLKINIKDFKNGYDVNIIFEICRNLSNESYTGINEKKYN